MSRQDKIIAATAYTKNRIFALKALVVCVSILGYLTYTQFIKPNSNNSISIEEPNTLTSDSPQVEESDIFSQPENYGDDKGTPLTTKYLKKRRKRKNKEAVEEQVQEEKNEQISTQKEIIYPPKPKEETKPVKQSITLAQESKIEQVTANKYELSKQNKEETTTYTSSIPSAANQQQKLEKSTNYRSIKSNPHQPHSVKVSPRPKSNRESKRSTTKSKTILNAYPKPKHQPVAAQKKVDIKVVSAYNKGKNEGIIELGDHSLSATERKKMNKGFKKKRPAIHFNLVPNKALKESNNGKLTFIIQSKDGQQASYKRPFSLQSGNETNLIINRKSFPFEENKGYTITILEGNQKLGQYSFQL